MTAHYAYGEKRERNYNIWKDRRDGMTLRAIGDKYHISPERIRQICIKIVRKIKQRKIHSRLKYRQDIILPEDFALRDRWIGERCHVKIRPPWSLDWL